MGMPGMGMPGMRMPPVPGMHPRAGVNPLATLNLTQEQLRQLQEIGKQAQTVSVDLMKKIGVEFVNLRSMLIEATPDAKQIGSAYQKVSEFQRQAIENAVTVYNRQVSILDPEQLKKWNALRAQMIARMIPPGQMPQSK
jgi:Spy/CpxP family protein refolding chaperone